MKKKIILYNYIYILFFDTTYAIYSLINYDTKKKRVAKWRNNPIVYLSVQAPLLQH